MLGRGIHVFILLVCSSICLVANAKPSASKNAAKQPQQPVNMFDKKFSQVKNDYREGEISSSELWEELNKLDGNFSKLSSDKQTNFLQLQASLLQESSYPILAAFAAAEAIESSKDPLAEDLSNSWQLLSEISQKEQLQWLLEDLANNVKIPADKSPKEFSSNWFYFQGNNLAKNGRNKEALEAYLKVNMNARYYLSARYQTAMIYETIGDREKTEVALRTLLNSIPQNLSPVDSNELKAINNYAKQALGRFYYQEKRFTDAVKFYRAVDRDSPLFYRSLFEQAWAFFMAGYPNHALGALHAVDSPFFKDNFNPESSMLNALIYFWLCRYDSSRNSLAKFSDNYSFGVTSLGTFLDRKKLSSETSYQLFDDLIKGVTSDSLGIPREVLNSAADQDSLLFLREQYASLTEEQERLEENGIFSNRTGVARASSLLRRKIAKLKNDIGDQFLVELRAQRAEYERLYEQAQFLYVELLMSEKEHLLGRELHASSKMDSVTPTSKMSTWGNGDQSWKSDEKNEYWWDEVGFYIYQVQPMCNK